MWVKFNQRVKKPGEAINTFIQDLRRLAEDCDYGALKDELIRDRTVVGVADDDLSIDLQTRANLTLVEAVQIARQAKAHKEGQEVRRKVDFVKHDSLLSPKNGHHHQKNPHNWHKPFNKQHPSQCSYCGREPHKRVLPCHCAYCSKKGQYKAVCRSCPSPVRELAEEADNSPNDDNYEFLGCINSVDDMDCRSAEIFLDGKPVSFKLDTGASVMVVRESMAKSKKLKPAKKSLGGPGNTSLNILGVFTATLSHKGTETEETIFVLADQHSGLPSRSACTRL